VRVCHEVRGAKAIVFREQNGRQEVSTPFGRPLEQTGCQFCAACVDVCPVGALRDNLEHEYGEPRKEIKEVCANLTNIVMDLYRIQQTRRMESSLCPVCGAGCKMSFELADTGEIVRTTPHPLGPANCGQACVQGRFLLKDDVRGPGRLIRPAVRRNGSIEETDWEEALGKAAGAFRDVEPGERAVLTNGRLNNEELYALQKFARLVLGTDAVACLTPAGHDAAASVLREEFGCFAATGRLADLSRAGCILTLGFNPPAHHPIAGVAVRTAVLAGAGLVCANPMNTAIGRYSDVELRHYPGTEAVLIPGLIKILLDEQGEDPAFSEKHGDDLEKFKEELAAYDVEKVSALTGLSQESLVEAACLMARADNVSVLFGPGLLHAPLVEEAVRLLAALTRIKGGPGKPGGGLFPVYGPGNLQGAWDMGFVSGLLPGQAGASDADARSRLQESWKSELPGGSSRNVFERIADGEIKTLYVAGEGIGGEALDDLRPFLEKVDTVILQDLFSPKNNNDINILLPLAAVAEKAGTITNGERRVQAAPAVTLPPEGVRPLLEVVGDLSMTLGGEGFADDRAVREEIRQVVPFYAGIDWERAKDDPPHWPCPKPGHPGTPDLFEEGAPEWNRPEVKLPVAEVEPVDGDYNLALAAWEDLVDYFYGPLLAREVEEAVHTGGDLRMNPTDAYWLEYEPGDEVTLETRHGNVTGRVAENKLLPRGLVAVTAELLPAVEGISVFAARPYEPEAEEESSEAGSAEAE
jgi:predicted molibdopterin-dependent oxidoreductase YjgC